ncbi:MAG: hypothetical protein QG591_2981 [Planctomycetota bacterium]|jgi:hypothetical protein|nr:hypothetical protein [Planctomycetota bacterium]
MRERRMKYWENNRLSSREIPLRFPATQIMK